MPRRFCFCGRSSDRPNYKHGSRAKSSIETGVVAVDTLTSVPVDVYNNMLKAADRSKVSGAHTLEKTRVRESGGGAFGCVMNHATSFVHLVRTKTGQDLCPNETPRT
mmetsp:Transcript_66143/g.104678  ORF Transcript_66143/g.104678 Transcript_66143/m.104678 type:complete len:107 (+) Transcript_66143:45-365(+)